MLIWRLTKRFTSTLLYFSGLVGAITTAFGLTQAIFTDKLVNAVSLNGNPCELGDDGLKHWEEIFSSNIGQFIFLDVNLYENPEICDSASLGEYPFMDENEETYHMPLTQPANAEYLPRLQFPVAEASDALLADGFLDFANEGSLIGSGLFFVDLQDNPHSGPTYRFVPAPYSLETSQMYRCTISFYEASDFFARSWAFTKNCITSF